MQEWRQQPRCQSIQSVGPKHRGGDRWAGYQQRRMARPVFLLVRSSKNEGQGGISSEVVCACSHGPCPEPCGGRERDLVIAPGARREWRIPVEIQAIPGGHTLSLELRWYERVNEEDASPKESQGDYNLVVDNLQSDCATVHLAGPSNKPLKLSVGRGRPPAA